MNNQEDVVYEKVSAIFPFVDGKSFTGKLNIRFPQSNLYQLHITSELKDDHERKWIGPKHTLKVRVL